MRGIERDIGISLVEGKAFLINGEQIPIALENDSSCGDIGYALCKLVK